jgi:hypothetical protein
MTTQAMRLKQKWVGTALCALASLGMWSSAAQGAENKPGEVDAKTRKELQAAEERFGQAIEKRDTAALSEILADYYADSIGDEERAIPKRGVIARAKAGTLFFYRIERDLQFSVSAQTYTVEGKAVPPPPPFSPDRAGEAKWASVRRMWTKKDDRWLLIMQNIREADDAEEEARAKEQKN